MNTPTPEHFNAIGRGFLPEHMGIVINTIESDVLSASIAIGSHHIAPNGFLHAGTVVTLADTTCGYGCLACLPAGASSFTTIELKTNFFGTAREGRITCTARLKHGGRSTQVWDAEVVHDQTGKTIAAFRCTQMILWPR